MKICRHWHYYDDLTIHPIVHRAARGEYLVGIDVSAKRGRNLSFRRDAAEIMPRETRRRRQAQGHDGLEEKEKRGELVGRVESSRVRLSARKLSRV